MCWVYILGCSHLAKLEKETPIRKMPYSICILYLFLIWCWLFPPKLYPRSNFEQQGSSNPEDLRKSPPWSRQSDQTWAPYVKIGSIHGLFYIPLHVGSVIDPPQFQPELTRIKLNIPAQIIQVTWAESILSYRIPYPILGPVFILTGEVHIYCKIVWPISQLRAPPEPNSMRGLKSRPTQIQRHPTQVSPLVNWVMFKSGPAQVSTLQLPQGMERNLMQKGIKRGCISSVVLLLFPS